VLRDIVDGMRTGGRYPNAAAVKHLAGTYGVSARTARRWVAQGRVPERGKGHQVGQRMVAEANSKRGKELRAAQKLGSGQATIDVGACEVEYEGQDEGTRTLGAQTVNLSDWYDAVQAGDPEAGQVLSGLFMDSYGANYLDVSDYGSFDVM
jgi:hypothetical protein